ncbi:MAG: putative rane-bound dehydrogenase, partial [Verrucomicrobiales bacterium]|nr:putative rane-bound dehydrogenase [Verrucomicrobiales bacterium]
AAAMGLLSASLLRASPLSPEAELATFQLSDTNLVVELVASEPDVTDPVALAWEADGKLYVVEMNDYPDGSGGGRI